MTEESQKAAQEKAIMYQIIQAQMEELSRQGATLEDKALEMEVAKNALEEVGKAESGSDMLVPIGAGCYGHGKLGSKDRFMVEIGSGLVSEMSLKEAIVKVEEKKGEIEKLHGRVEAEMRKLQGSMDQLGLELNSMMIDKAKDVPKQDEEGDDEEEDEKEAKSKSSDIIVE